MPSTVVGIVVFSLMGIVFHLLQEDNPMATLNATLQYLAEYPDPENRKRHVTVWLGLIATAIFGLAPLGWQMMESHSCGAWFSFSLALLCGGCTFWAITPIRRIFRIAILMVIVLLFGFYARRSLYANTELDFFFVHPGVFLIVGSGEWDLLVTGQNTHRSLFNADMILQDMVTSRAIPNEPNLAKRGAMAQGSIIHKHYSEIGPAFPGDHVEWAPIDVNNQEYYIQATYRIGDQSFLDSEEIKIVNVGERFVSASATPNPKIKFQESITIKNQVGQVLMHCIDRDFPRTSTDLDGPVCYPGAKFAPLPRSFCTRCFGRGFEFYRDN